MPSPRCRFSSGLCVLGLLLTACHRSPPFSPQAVYQHARELLDREQLPQAFQEAERGLAAAPPRSKLAWSFRLLRAEILLAGREARLAASALAVAPPANPDFGEILARYRLCQAHLALLRHDRSEAAIRLEEARSSAETLPPGRLLAEIALRRAALAIAFGDSSAARSSLQRVLAYAAAHRDPFLQMSANGSFGYMLSQDDRYDEAIPWFEKAAAEARLLGAGISEARAIGNLGYCRFELGDFAKALKQFRFAESRFAATGTRYERQIWLGNIGNIEEANREYDAAAADYARALAISKDLKDDYWSAVWLDDLAAVSIERRDWNSAERFNIEALSRKRQVKDEQSLGYSLVNAGQIANGRGQHQDAIDLFRRVLARPNQDVILLLDAHSGLAEAYAALGRDGKATGEFRMAVAEMGRQQAALLDQEQKLTWFASVIRTYQDFVLFLMQRGHDLEALQVVQSSRGRVLTSRTGGGEPSGQSTPRDLRRIAARSRSTLLVYFVAPQKSYAWVIDRSGIRHFELPGEAELGALVSTYANFIQQLRDPLAENCRAGEALFERLIAPAQVKTERVMLAPDGPLYSLNFATLPVASGGKVHYWLRDVQISVVPSFDLVPPRSPAKQRSLLLIGDPVVSDPEYSELTFASQEMTAIEQRLPGVRKVSYSRTEARPDVYARTNPEQFSWIHFVAHATANDDEPLQSAVILSSRQGADYHLFARDVLRIPLRAELVTISACRSAGAKIYGGEGLVGFSWAFLKSGARNVIAGLWDVNDRSTADLMTRLYAQLSAEASPAAALHTAQLAMAGSPGVFRKPFYWGPFVDFKTAE